MLALDDPALRNPRVNSLPQDYRALVVGSSGGIGQALVDALRADSRCLCVRTLSRSDSPGFDLTNEDSLRSSAAALRAEGPLHLILCATGVLQVLGKPPEKRLADLDAATLAHSFSINAIGPALLIKHLHDLLPTRERCFLAVLSARVGSIGDNRKGGWYAYRAGKAALNMLLRTAAIEVARRRPLAVLAALHPGTVRSGLSAPILGDAPATPPADAARHLLAVLDALPTEGASGSFLAWDGSAVPW
jgi:NAD(P)-dependent dehydrogenase (short-subunit alcohol dehydrogenase family)